MSEQLTVAGLAARVGVSPDAVRYYERLGLLPPPERSTAGYRRYDQGAVQRLRFVKGAQRVGLRLREIAELEIVDRGQCPCGHTEALLRQRLAEVAVELARLGALRGELARLLAQAPEQGCTVETAEGWWCVQAFAREGGGGDGGVPELRLPCGERPCPCCGAA
jgi:MerR family transcriptional regulator, mercuric resistance operon regulatory protein